MIGTRLELVWNLTCSEGIGRGTAGIKVSKREDSDTKPTVYTASVNT